MLNISQILNYGNAVRMGEMNMILYFKQAVRVTACWLTGKHLPLTSQPMYPHYEGNYGAILPEFWPYSYMWHVIFNSFPPPLSVVDTCKSYRGYTVEPQQLG